MKMTTEFDPYYTWLGIPPLEQPPDHYRLLGLRQFEDNDDAISNACDGRMVFIRTFQTGKHSPESQELLNKVSEARICLLKPEKKRAYDEQLQKKVNATSQIKTTLTQIQPVSQISSFGDSQPRHHPKQSAERTGVLERLRSDWRWQVGAAGSAVALILLVVIVISNLGSSPEDPPRVVQQDPNESKDSVPPVPPATNDVAPTPDDSPRVPNDGSQKAVDPLPNPTVRPRLEGNPDDPENPDRGTNPNTETKDPPKEVDPPPPPKPPQPKVSPFAKLARSIDLPTLGSTSDPNPDATKRVILGAVKLGMLEIFTAEMSGGDQAHNSKQTFTMRNADGGLAERAFEIYLKKSNNDELMIAKWGIEEHKLWFEWTKKAQQEVAANYVRNCLLTLATGTETHQLALREPVSFDPLTIDLDKGTAGKATARLDFLPQQNFVTVELSVPDDFPTHTFDANKDSIKVACDSTKILVGDPGQQMLFFHVTSTMKGKNIVEISALPKVKTERRKSVVFRKKEFDRQFIGLQALVVQRTASLVQLEKAAKMSKQLKPRLDATRNQLFQLQAQVTALEKVNQFIQNVNGATVNVRIFYRAGDYQVDLATTN